MPPDVMVTPEFVMCSSRIGEVSPCFAVVIYWMVGAVVCGEFSVYSTLWGMVEVESYTLGGCSFFCACQVGTAPTRA